MPASDSLGQSSANGYRPLPAGAALLDLDGTLVDTEPLHVLAHRRQLDRHGIAVSDQEIWGNIGKGDVAFYERLLRRAGMTADAAALVEGKSAILRQIYSEQAVPWCAGAEALIARLRHRGCCAVVVTSSDRLTAAAALASAHAGTSAGGGSRLTLRVCADDVRRRKPDPEPYALAATRLGVKPQNCWAVEDSVAGVTSAVAAGVGTVIAVPGHISASVLSTAGAHRVATSLHEVVTWLR